MGKVDWSQYGPEEAVIETIRAYLKTTDRTCGKWLEKLEDHEIQDRIDVRKEDPVYSVFGLGSRGYEIAIAGNSVITSVHRQIGKAFEEITRGLIAKRLGYDDHDTFVQKRQGQALGMPVTREYDCVLDPTTLPDPLPPGFQRDLDEVLEEVRLTALETVTERVEAGKDMEFLQPVRDAISQRGSLDGIGMEIRHCYKSADSKRKQGDLQAVTAFAEQGVMPVMMVFCQEATQMDAYRNKGWGVLEASKAFEALEKLSGFALDIFLKDHQGQVRAILPNLATFFEEIS